MDLFTWIIVTFPIWLAVLIAIMRNIKKDDFKE